MLEFHSFASLRGVREARMRFVKGPQIGPAKRPFYLCTEHIRQLEGESPFDNPMEVKS